MVLAAPGALGLVDALGPGGLLLGALWVLATDEVRAPANGPVGDAGAGVTVENGPTGASLAPDGLGPAATVASGPETVASTSVVCTPATARPPASDRGPGCDCGADATPSFETAGADGRAASTRLGLTVYRTSAAPAPVPNRIANISSNAIFASTPALHRRLAVICDGVKRATQRHQLGAPRRGALVLAPGQKFISNASVRPFNSE